MKISNPILGCSLAAILALGGALVGLWLWGPNGILIGGIAAIIVSQLLGLIDFQTAIQGSHCELCGRAVQKLGESPSFMGSSGIWGREEDLQQGAASLGAECRRCGRIYCAYCTTIGMTCKCGSDSFRTIPLRYT
jgi:hypothetical protein